MMMDREGFNMMDREGFNIVVGTGRVFNMSPSPSLT